MSVIPDGIDTGTIRPDPDARFVLPGGQVVTAEDELVTYAARGLEPYRGFPGFMRALPEVLRRRPAAQVVIAGADEAIYGRGPPQGGSWRAALGDELGLDPRRVHFVGTLPQEGLRRLFQVSTVHAYLTVPFVLSWSLLEAMAAGCMVVASRTPPVAEVIEDGVNGWLVDFFDVAGLSDRLVAALAERATLGRLRAAARATVATRYDLTVCVPQHIALIRALAAGDLPAAG